ncbi:hypothetical protein PSENEW3_00001357 [Picochlorum sp. SENEW3]|nr:hypothetical protein PSENEW3_00001357 [Picochlorum sp. SENEW3]
MRPALLYTLQDEMPINVYSTVQTGPNNQFGGCQDGFLIVGNHVFTSSRIEMPMLVPPSKGIAMLVPSDNAFPMPAVLQLLLLFSAIQEQNPIN